MSIAEDIPVEGEITVPVGSRSPDEDYSTLDEPVRETIVSLCLHLRSVACLPDGFGQLLCKSQFCIALLDWYFIRSLGIFFVELAM